VGMRITCRRVLSCALLYLTDAGPLWFMGLRLTFRSVLSSGPMYLIETSRLSLVGMSSVAFLLTDGH
jgi:hypothetical protein